MGSRIFVAMEGEDPGIPAAMAQVPGWFAHWEGTFSRFLPESELSQLNQNQTAPFKASLEMLEVLELAQEMRKKTGGWVTPTVLDALLSNGYDADFATLATREHPGSLAITALPPDALEFDLDAKTGWVWLPKGVRLDLGGFAKGWAANQAMKRLSALAPALVNAGGDIAISGPQTDGEAWLIGVENPLEPGENIAMVEMRKGGIATSGKDYRRWMKDGQLKHHLIDPLTGMPAISDVFSATIIAPNVMLAESAAKVAVIGGSGAGCEWLDAQNDMAYFLQLENGQIISSSTFEQYLWKPHELKNQQ